MKLLSPTDARSKIQKNNDELIESNIRLRKGLKQVISDLNNAKNDYSSDRVKLLKDFDRFIEEIQVKKNRLLKELKDLTEEIDRKKEVYYGLITKQDMLEEKLYQLNEREIKINLRENFVKDLEKKHGL